jgi:ubiquinone/menaquinone biosynthesis C-methylase UbiE
MVRELNAFHYAVRAVTLLVLPTTIYGFAHGVGGFGKEQKMNQMHGANNPPQKNFHKVLQEAGKTILRPGALVASNTLHSWAKLSPKDRVLELASGLGRGGIDIAKKYGCQEVLLSDVDDGRLLQDCQTVRNLDVEDRAAARKINMFKLGQAFDLPSDDPTRFNVVITEASLTHHSMQQKARFFEGSGFHLCSLSNNAT